jgi:hypothetical protein
MKSIAEDGKSNLAHICDVRLLAVATNKKSNPIATQ